MQFVGWSYNSEGGDGRHSEVWQLLWWDAMLFRVLLSTDPFSSFRMTNLIEIANETLCRTNIEKFICNINCFLHVFSLLS